MIRPIPLEVARQQYDFIPQAVVREPVRVLAERVGSTVEVGSDGLDHYRGAAGLIEDFPPLGDSPFAVMNYVGHPTNTTTIYLPFDIKDISTITDIVSRILLELRLSTGVLEWQRRDNPEL